MTSEVVNLSDVREAVAKQERTIDDQIAEKDERIREYLASLLASQRKFTCLALMISDEEEGYETSVFCMEVGELAVGKMMLDRTVQRVVLED